ncbi:MAG: NAD(P)/FAD-dependent oxidoreductase [Cyanobacteria bacterium P01_D01_bin.50]
MLKKVAIVGAGPCGLLLANYLLSRNGQYHVEIYERRADPRIASYANSRTFPIALNEKGYNALREIPRLEEAVKDASCTITNMVSHQKNGTTKVMPRSKPLFCIDRTDLVKVLLEELTSKYHSPELKINFNCKCHGVVEPGNISSGDFPIKSIKFRNLETKTDFNIDCDLLIGADGAFSVVREIFAGLSDSFKCSQEYVPTAYKTIFISASDNNHWDGLGGKFHFWNKMDNYARITLIEGTDGSLSGVIRFIHKNNDITNISSVEEALNYFGENCPQLKELMSRSDVEAFVNNPVSQVITVHCNRYHLGENALLIGDAAHAVSPASGKGCNNALEDVWILNNLLDECSDNWAEAIEKFTISHKSDGDAVVELSSYIPPITPKLFIEFGFRQGVSKALHKLFPQYLLPPIFKCLPKPTVIYSKIFHYYKSWIAKVKKSNENLFAKLS